MIEKPKSKRQHTPYLQFLAVWVTGLALVSFCMTLFSSWFITIAIIQDWYNGVTIFAFNIISSLLLTTLYALTQQTLIRRAYGLVLKPWVVSSVLGIFIGAGLNFLLGFLSQNNFELNLVMSRVIPALTVASVQVYILNRYLKQAWSWLAAVLLGSFISAFTTISLVSTNIGTLSFVLIPIVIAPLLTGSAFIWMLRQTIQQRVSHQSDNLVSSEYAHLSSTDTDGDLLYDEHIERQFSSMDG